MAYASYIIDASKKSKYTMFVKEITVMNFENCFPLWNDLNTTQKKIISDNLITQYVKKGTIIHNGNLDCTGLLLVKSGQLRTYILSDEGREITLYRRSPSKSSFWRCARESGVCARAAPCFSIRAICRCCLINCRQWMG